MPTRDERVQLLVGSVMHDAWESYEVDSDLLTPADAWHVNFGLNAGRIPAGVNTGAAIELRVGGEKVMVGTIDERRHKVTKESNTVSLAGRDSVAKLLDCAAPIFVAQMSDLPQIVAKVVRPLVACNIRIDADKTRIRKKINVEPGDRAWEVLVRVAEANGLWAWCDPDGTLVIGGPDYTTPVVASLVMTFDGPANNLLSLEEVTSEHSRFTEVTVLSQTCGTEQEEGKHALRGTARDQGMSGYRPQLVVDHESDTPAVCEDRARKLLADSRLSAFTLTAEVKGHRIVAPGQKSDGVLWKPGQRLHVRSEPHDIDAVFFVMARRFIGGRRQVGVTHLTLKEDGVWVLDAHPHQRKHRRGKNAGPGAVLDLASGAAG
ncbi:MAG: phage tail protein [Rhodocyclales bacterium]|nr:phage tail protein [Rhodocyclales bacterium]